MVFEHKVVKDGSCDKPACNIGGSCWWHSSETIRYNWYVYQWNPFLVWIDFAQYPNRNWQESSNEVQPYQVTVHPPRSKEPLWSNQTPYYRSIKGHSEFRAGPRALRMKCFNVADVLNALQHPPCNCKVHYTRN